MDQTDWLATKRLNAVASVFQTFMAFSKLLNVFQAVAGVFQTFQTV